MPYFAGKRVYQTLAQPASLPANSTACPVSRVNPQKPHLPYVLSYPRIRWSALFRGYACVSYCYRTCFLTREFDGQPHFAGKPAETSLAIRASLPANSMVCPVSRVNPQKPHLPYVLSYPRIRWSALFRGSTRRNLTCQTCFLTREFLYAPSPVDNSRIGLTAPGPIKAHLVCHLPVSVLVEVVPEKHIKKAPAFPTDALN